MNIEEVDRNGHVKEKISYRNSMLHYGLYTPEKVFFRRSHGTGTGNLNSAVLPAALSATRPAGRNSFWRRRCHLCELRGAPCPVSGGSSEKIRLHSQFFDREFLAGMEGSIFDLQYIAPGGGAEIAGCGSHLQQAWKNAEFLEGLHRGIALSQEEGPFFELRLRSLFSRLWETVYGWAAGEEQEGSRYNAAEDERIKQMLTWIGGHYGEKLTVEEDRQGSSCKQEGVSSAVPEGTWEPLRQNILCP